MAGQTDERVLVVLESDWSQERAAESMKRSDPVGPAHSYRDLFGAPARLFDAQLDYAQFASEAGFSALVQRFASRKKAAPWLIVTGHGSPKGIHPAGGAFDPWVALTQELRGGRAHGKDGLLFAACGVAKYRVTADRLLSADIFQWVAGYRDTAYGLSGLMTELCFWRAFFDGWRWKKKGRGSRARAAPDAKPRDAIAAGLLTNLEIVSSVTAGFDVKTLDASGDVVSSLEIFSVLAARHLEWTCGLEGIKASPASKRAAERYQRLFDTVWDEGWSRQVEA